MKYIMVSFFLLLTLVCGAQQMTWPEWELAASEDIRLLPKYGHVQKNELQKAADQRFIATSLAADSTHRKASDHLIELGFKYIYRDMKTAMYRFNQAFLLDSTNTDIYWGYGGVYMILGKTDLAREQYETGLQLDPENTHLLTDYGTSFMAEYYGLAPNDKIKIGDAILDTAIVYMTKSYGIDPTDQNTSFKLSVLYLHKGDCENAWKFYKRCKKYGGDPIPPNYVIDLEKRCKR